MENEMAFRSLIKLKARLMRRDIVIARNDDNGNVSTHKYVVSAFKPIQK